MTDAEKIDELEKKVKLLMHLLNELLVMAVQITTSDRRRHLNQAHGHEELVEKLTKNHDQLSAAMTPETGHGSHGKTENGEKI